MYLKGSPGTKPKLQVLWKWTSLKGKQPKAHSGDLSPRPACPGLPHRGPSFSQGWTVWGQRATRSPEQAPPVASSTVSPCSPPPTLTALLSPGSEIRGAWPLSCKHLEGPRSVSENVLRCSALVGGRQTARVILGRICAKSGPALRKENRQKDGDGAHSRRLGHPWSGGAGAPSPVFTLPGREAGLSSSAHAGPAVRARSLRAA